MKEISRPTTRSSVAVKLHPGSVLDPTRVKETIQGIKQVYQDKGYLDAKVTFAPSGGRTTPRSASSTSTEGPKVQISDGRFRRQQRISSRELRNTIETQQHNILSCIFDTGVLDQKKLQDDVDRITAFYYNHGYLNVHVSEPVVTRVGNSLKVRFDIDEGPVYQVGRVDVAGDLKCPKKELLAKLTIKPGQDFSGARCSTTC